MASMSRNTCRRLFSLEGDDMWSMDQIINLPVLVKVIILVAGMCIGTVFFIDKRIRLLHNISK